MERKLDELKTKLAEIKDLQAVSALLEWDQAVYMPKGALEDRGEQIAAIEQISHIKATSDEIGSLLDDLVSETASLDPDSDDARLVKVAKRNYEKATKLTPEFVAEFARTATVAQTVWEKAKDDSDFSQFQPYLERLVELRRQYADFF